MTTILLIAILALAGTAAYLGRRLSVTKLAVREAEQRLNELTWTAQQSPEDLRSLRADVLRLQRLDRAGEGLTLAEAVSRLPDDLLQALSLTVAAWSARQQPAPSASYLALLEAKREFLNGRLPEDAFESKLMEVAENQPATLQDALIRRAVGLNGGQSFLQVTRQIIQQHGAHLATIDAKSNL